MTQKRSASINLHRMRKQFTPRPLALGVASLFLAACSDNREDVIIYKTLEDCTDDNPNRVQACTLAYEEALEEARKTGPKYANMQTCEYDFGPRQCEYVDNNGGSFFMPLMAGYMLGNLLSPNRYYSQPLFTSYSPYSPYRYRYIMADGYDIGDLSKKRTKVKPGAFKPKPEIKKTMSRGGFGSTVRAKSSWGSSSRKSGWGG
ncbi:DUF1190 domain-containing protein [Aestuariibacter sp. AA17]|uniref:DUF1190 domain-containing protein n=1 Tax=Fluctibacter corallii TaxID=2984329 RepID=A0ABT3ABN3_9ALTE|nr:DUF1190 domain-containing protein [Aestuariibacter sp. AA17]MCV2886068.1 DUF1190 domain-containing protein [Aestuariibacter sp. AA17]